MIKFIFDLDSTLTSLETLPLIAQHFGIAKDMESLTEQAVQGLIPFEESLEKRMRMLGSLPVDAVAKLLATMPLYETLHAFILQNNERCCIATGNVDAWLKDFAPRLGCEIFCSKAYVENNAITKLTEILDKKKIVQDYQAAGYTVVFIGDGDNDVQAMLSANIAIAVGMTHALAPHVAAAAQHVLHTENDVFALLHQLLAQHTN